MALWLTFGGQCHQCASNFDLMHIHTVSSHFRVEFRPCYCLRFVDLDYAAHTLKCVGLMNLAAANLSPVHDQPPRDHAKWLLMRKRRPAKCCTRCYPWSVSPAMRRAPTVLWSIPRATVSKMTQPVAVFNGNRGRNGPSRRTYAITMRYLDLRIILDLKHML